jgi:hypothetical protein
MRLNQPPVNQSGEFKFGANIVHDHIKLRRDVTSSIAIENQRLTTHLDYGHELE